jgi:hypothetical protein
MIEDVPMIYEREAGMREDIPQVGVGFCLYPLKDDAASEAEGREIFKDVEFVKIQVPGDRETIVFQPATKEHHRRFPTAYRMFKENNAVAQQGTPIEQWPAIGRGAALTFKAAGIPTVEALAEVHDGNLEKLGSGSRELRALARGWIAQAKDSAVAQKLEKEKQQLLDVIADLQGQIRDLAARFGADPDEVTAKPAKSKKPAPRKKAA